MKKKTIVAFAAAVVAVSLSGCISTQEMPLAPNMVRLDTQAQGLLFTGQTVPNTMRAAANATLSRGYSHFRFADAGMSQGSVVAGTFSNANVSYGNGYANGFGSTSVIHAPTANAAATVIMFHANEPGAHGAFDATQVLKQYAQ